MHWVPRLLLGTVAFGLFFTTAAGAGALVAANYYGPDIQWWRLNVDLAVLAVCAGVSYWCLHTVSLRLGA